MLRALRLPLLHARHLLPGHRQETLRLQRAEPPTEAGAGARETEGCQPPNNTLQYTYIALYITYSFFCAGRCLEGGCQVQRPRGKVWSPLQGSRLGH